MAESLCGVVYSCRCTNRPVRLRDRIGPSLWSQQSRKLKGQWCKSWTAQIASCCAGRHNYPPRGSGGPFLQRTGYTSGNGAFLEAWHPHSANRTWGTSSLNSRAPRSSWRRGTSHSLTNFQLITGCLTPSALQASGPPLLHYCCHLLRPQILTGSWCSAIAYCLLPKSY